ncbi:MAG: hypothetical protein ACYTGQ_20105 [Planctomycetota bacterium]|jgi:hypothetical protein
MMIDVLIFGAGAASMLFGLVIAGRLHAWRRARHRGKAPIGVNSIADAEETVVAVLKREGETQNVA